MARSVGCYDMASYAIMTFLQLFLFERFTNYAKPHAIPKFKSSLDQATRTVVQVQNDMSRALRWKGKGRSKSLAQFIDVEEAFIFRPYAQHLLGEVDLMLHLKDMTPIDIKEDDIPIMKSSESGTPKAKTFGTNEMY
ncbi:hypothetical protein F0562_010390 [Nyssa sinensis]|uniref:Uncharacterized protein n=1 Tax=Nyssa sinensis TaxID=561372 RepID=A0A5J5A1L8_9ASTE|nr:hypothetical protein F0562_010390 [Nyssa sinensis]